MNKLAKWKKKIFLIVIALVTVRILYIWIGGEVDKEYYVSKAYDLSAATELPCQNITESFVCTQERLNSLELVFNNIAQDKAGSLTLEVLKDRNIIYKTNIPLSGINNRQWKKIYVNIDIEEGAEYTISLNANEGCTQIPMVLVVEEGADEVLRSFQEGIEISGNVAINFGYLRRPGMLDRLSISSLWVFFAVAVYVFLASVEKMTALVKKAYTSVTKYVSSSAFYSMIEVLGAIIIINSSGIEFQAPTKVILYIISLISAIGFEEKRKYTSILIDKPAKRVFMYFLYVYAAFALVGQRLLIYPLTMKLTAAGITVFFVAVFWFVPVVNTLLYYLEIAAKNSFEKSRRLKTLTFVLLCTAVLLMPAGYNLLANNPGISSPDTAYSMITNAQNLYGMYDWHPAFYCMVLRVIEEVCNSTYAVIGVQYFFWAYVMNELFLFLRKKGLRENVLIGAAIFSGFNAGNFIHINTIWKDIPYTLSLLWAFVILIKLVIDYEEYKCKWYIYLELIVSMIGICLYRKNGVVSFVIIAAALVIVLRKNVKVWASVAAAIALVSVIKGPVYHYFEVEDTGKHGIYIGLGQDILGVYYAGGEVSSDTLEMITMMTAGNNAEYSYTPTWSYASYDVDVEPAEFIKNYIMTFIKNPVIMTRAIIDREDALWDIFEGQDSVLSCVNYTGTLDFDERYEWNEYYPVRQYMSLHTGMSAATNYTASTQWIAAIEWRSGLFTLLGLTVIVHIVIFKGLKKYLIITAPIAGHILSLLLSTGWSDFRYFWPMNLINMAVILLALVILKPNTGVAGGR